MSDSLELIGVVLFVDSIFVEKNGDAVCCARVSFQLRLNLEDAAAFDVDENVFGCGSDGWWWW